MKKILLTLVVSLTVSSFVTKIAEAASPQVCAATKKFTKQDMITAYKAGYLMAGGNWEQFKHAKTYAINWQVLKNAGVAHKQ